MEKQASKQASNQSIDTYIAPSQTGQYFIHAPLHHKQTHRGMLLSCTLRILPPLRLLLLVPGSTTSHKSSHWLFFCTSALFALSLHLCTSVCTSGCTFCTSAPLQEAFWLRGPVVRCWLLALCAVHTDGQYIHTLTATLSSSSPRPSFAYPVLPAPF